MNMSKAEDELKKLKNPKFLSSVILVNHPIPFHAIEEFAIIVEACTESKMNLQT